MNALKQIRFKYIPCVMALGLVCLYVHCMIYFPLDPFKLTPFLLAKIFFIAIVCNVGLAFISLDIAKTYKKLSTLFFIPAVTITPIIAGLYFIPAFFVVIIMNVYFYIRLNPWEKNEMGPICA